MCDLDSLLSLSCCIFFNELFLVFVSISRPVKTKHRKSSRGFNCFGRSTSLSPAQIWDQVGVDSSQSILLCVKERRGEGDSVGIYDPVLENDFKQENDC